MAIELISRGNALGMMRHLPDGIVDFLLTIPPESGSKNKWRSDFALDEFWKQARRIVSENGCIAIIAQPPFSYKIATSAADIFRYEWIIKAKGRPSKSSTGPLLNHASVLIFYKKKPFFNPQPAAIKNSGPAVSDILPFAVALDHPVNIAIYLIKTYTDKNMTVFDPFMGTGATGCGCKITERSFIGFEENENIFKTAVDNISKTKMIGSNSF